MDNKYLKLAREAREENNTEDAKKFYDMARTEDPENVEAKFFYAYYNLNDAINRDVPNKFVDYSKVAVASVKKLKEAEISDEEKMELLEVFVDVHAKEAPSIYHYVRNKLERHNSDGTTNGGIYDISEVNMVQRASIHSLEDMGNSVANLFGDNPKGMELAANLWKALLKENAFSSWYFFQSGENKEESKKKWNELIEKIKQVDAAFVAPAEPKAIQCGSK